MLSSSRRAYLAPRWTLGNNFDKPVSFQRCFMACKTENMHETSHIVDKRVRYRPLHHSSTQEYEHRKELLFDWPRYKISCALSWAAKSTHRVSFAWTFLCMDACNFSYFRSSCLQFSIESRIPRCGVINVVRKIRNEGLRSTSKRRITHDLRLLR